LTINRAVNIIKLTNRLINWDRQELKAMNFVDLRKPNATHLYYAYVFATDDNKPSCIFRLCSVKDFKRKMRDQHRKYDIVKVW